ncbi:EAL domain-containing protein [Glaciecola sp. MF2-115]|uniref:EAL domain-containing protein n=1 Tax=Glaciecola sp. MF2-115 TaxID=3384827 RepID=UPI00399F06ED
MTKFFNYLTKSLALTQAIIALILSIVIGFLISAVSLNTHLSDQRESALGLAEEILTAAEGGATNAVWTLDPALAEQVIGSMTALGMVQEAVLIGETGNTLAEDRKPLQKNSDVIDWLISNFIGDEIKGERNLFIERNNTKRKIGVLSIKLDLSPVAQEFMNVATSVIVTGLLQALTIAFILLWLSSWLLTTPLIQVTESISKIDPENPDPLALSNLKIHYKNELGQLVSHINQMLQGLIRAQVQLRHLATTDALTDQPNRTLIVDRLSQAIKKAERTKTKVAVLFVDMDRFKNINDSLGHDVGDILLVEVANRLVSALRSNDSIGRLGGDEFLIVIEGHTELNEVVKAVQRLDEALSRPYLLQNHEIRTSGSIGISIYPDNGVDTNKLMRCADLAMYEAKGSGSNWHFYAKDMSDKVEARLRIEAALNYAVEREEFHLNYQPKLNSQTGKLVGCEALIRWNNNPEPISVEGFIKIAEESGLIIAIGDWVLETACKQIKKWEKEYGGISIAVNVSAKQMQQDDYVERVLAMIKKYDVNPNLLELEITETVLMKALDESFIALKQLRQHGIRISIDDFGTGYCSLSYLSRLPIDTLKIDRSFVSGEQASIAVLEMIVAMAKALNLKTVAEGVETEEQRDWLIQEGCDYLQGYLISKPILADEFEKLFLSDLKT